MLPQRSRRRMFLGSMLAILVVVPSLRGDVEKEPENVVRIKHLIELLASKNKAPKVRGNINEGDDEDISFPKSYDKSLQVPVYLAVKELLNEDEAVIDLLLAHRNDDRYSFSVNFANRDFNVTVARACRDIVDRKISCYEPEMEFISKGQYGVRYPDLDPQADHDKAWKTWWNKNKKRGLATLQIEAIDSMIEFMTKADGRTATPIHPDAEPLPIKEFNRKREQNLRKLKAIRQYIVDSKTPYHPTALFDDAMYIFGLPWTGRHFNL
jgi:hypothetical protein